MAFKFTGKRIAAIIACVLLTFRSSASLLMWLADQSGNDSLLKKVFSNSEFIASTAGEETGIWSLNAYMVRRETALAMSVLLMVLIYLLPFMYEGFERLKHVWDYCEKDADNAGAGKKRFGKIMNSCFNVVLQSLLIGDDWIPDNVICAVCFGVLTGLLGFFDHTILVTVLLIIAFLFVVSDKRLEHLICFAVAFVLALAEKCAFTSGSAFNPVSNYGFLADNQTFPSVILYLLFLLGLLPLIIVIYFAFADAVGRAFVLAACVPVFFAFHYILKQDISSNSPMVLASVLLFDVIAADMLYKLFKHRKFAVRVLAALALICLISTGIFDTLTLVKADNPANAVVNNLDEPIINWIDENCRAEDVFLTSDYSLGNSTTGSSIILSGATLYMGCEKYAKSAGYNTNIRAGIVNELYSCPNLSRIKELIAQEGIDYIVIDESNRRSMYYNLNEAIFEENFEAVYRQGSGQFAVTVYKAH